MTKWSSSVIPPVRKQKEKRLIRLTRIDYHDEKEHFQLSVSASKILPSRAKSQVEVASESQYSPNATRSNILSRANRIFSARSDPLPQITSKSLAHYSDSIVSHIVKKWPFRSSSTSVEENRAPWGSRRALKITYISKSRTLSKISLPVKEEEGINDIESGSSEAETSELPHDGVRNEVILAEVNTMPEIRVPSKEPALPLVANPLVKLRISQYNLATGTMGCFHGPGDVYYRFILGGRSLAPGAKALKTLKANQLNLGKLDEILVIKAKNKKSTPNNKTIWRLRELHQVEGEVFINTKVAKLEQIRA